MYIFNGTRAHFRDILSSFCRHRLAPIWRALQPGVLRLTFFRLPISEYQSLCNIHAPNIGSNFFALFEITMICTYVGKWTKRARRVIFDKFQMGGSVMSRGHIQQRGSALFFSCFPSFCAAGLACLPTLMEYPYEGVGMGWEGLLWGN